MKSIKKLKFLLASLLLLMSSATQNLFAQVRRHPTFVLVPGAWHGGWCWQKVASNLRARGDVVYTPSLSGLGEHKNIPAKIVDLKMHISDIVNLIIAEDLHDVVLVGHSFSGTVIAGVADRVPERLSKLVFLDAMIVRNGESALSIQPKKIQEDFIRSVAANNGISLPAPDAGFFGIKDPKDVKWVNARLISQPAKSITQKQILHHPFGNGLPLIFIACRNPELEAVKKFADETRRSKAWKFYSLDTGHDAMITVPNEVANLFEVIAGR